MKSSIDRKWDPQKTISYPIAFGLKGGKFDLDVKRSYFGFIMDSNC